MARTPLGTIRQGVAKTALYAYFAARLRGVPTRDLGKYLTDLGLAVGPDGVLRAGSQARMRRPGETPRGPKRKDAGPRSPATSRRVFVDSLLIDALRLDVELAVALVPGTGASRRELVEALEHVPGVRQVIETAHRRDIHLVLMFEGPRHRKDLRARLNELVPELIWDDVLYESRAGESAAWEELARRTAIDERLTR
jgi:hypothetical protein